MKRCTRLLPVFALSILACDVDDETATRVGDGVIGQGVEADAADAVDDIEEITAAADPSFACSDAGWNAGWATLEAAVLTEINKRRAAGATCGGVVKPKAAALVMNTAVRCAARNHSKDMATQNFFSHAGSNGSSFAQRITLAGYAWTGAAENISAGYSTAVAAVNAWMASSGHCNNIMNGTYKVIGVGYAYNASSAYKHYWTTDFAKP